MPLIDRKRLYVRIAETALGHPLPEGAVVHHVDENRTHNWNSNLCVLQSAAEHRQLHRRLRIRQAGGNPWTQQICSRCWEVKDLTEFPPSKRHTGHNCNPCAADINNARYHAKQGREARRLTPEEAAVINHARTVKAWATRKGVSHSTH